MLSRANSLLKTTPRGSRQRNAFVSTSVTEPYRSTSIQIAASFRSNPASDVAKNPGTSSVPLDAAQARQVVTDLAIVPGTVPAGSSSASDPPAAFERVGDQELAAEGTSRSTTGSSSKSP
jgi:hypothetical protein